MAQFCGVEVRVVVPNLDGVCECQAAVALGSRAAGVCWRRLLAAASGCGSVGGCMEGQLGGMSKGPVFPYRRRWAKGPSPPRWSTVKGRMAIPAVFVAMMGGTMSLLP